MNSSKVTAFGGATYHGEEPVSNQTVEEFLLAALGPQQMDNRALLLLVTIFYAVVFVTGVVGNLSVCLVITRTRSLHSAMNYYLVSLAVADLTIILLGKLVFKAFTLGGLVASGGWINLQPTHSQLTCILFSPFGQSCHPLRWSIAKLYK